MSDTFNFSRFGKYFVSDFRNTFNKVWLSVLLYSLAGLFAYLFCGVLRLFIEGSWASYGLVGRVITFLAVLYIMIMVLPSKAYGYFTDKRQGEFFSMIPVSPLEKAITMILNTAVIAPVVYLVIALCADALLCLVDPQCGETLVSQISRFCFTLNCSFNQNCVEDGDLALSAGLFFAGVVVNILSWVLSFLLGALYFKKNKIGMTILALILVSMVSSMAFTPLMLHFGEGVLNMMNDAVFHELLNGVMWGSLALSTVIVIAMMFWVYLRVRNVKR